MTSYRIVLGIAAGLAAAAVPVMAQERPALHELDDFLSQGAFSMLDRDLAGHRLPLSEIERGGLDGRPTPVASILATMAGYEKLKPRVEEPLEVRGDLRVTLTPNTTGAEAYTTCFEAMTYNGLVLSGRGDELILVRPESHPELDLPRRGWNRDLILPTRLYRLGYLASDPILRRYHQEIGTREGHAVLIMKANVVIVTDADPALQKLGNLIDAETLAAMGDPDPVGGPRPPSLGAVASRECAHFYLLAFARANRIPISATRRPAAARHYPEADLWLGDHGYETLLREYRRVSGLAPMAREAVARGWVDPNPGRTLSPEAQGRMAIRFGLVDPLPGAERPRAAGKPARRKR